MNADAAQMNALHERERLNDLSRRTIGAAQRVSSSLGYGFLEKVYENALCFELRKRGLRINQQMPLQVFYEGVIVGDYIPDIMVEDALIVERAADLRLGLLLNFGRAHLEVGRVVHRF